MPPPDTGTVPTLRTFLTAAIGVALGQGAAVAVAAGGWDCRPAADGSGWDCRGQAGDGASGPVTRAPAVAPVVVAEPEETAAARPAETAGRAPAPAESVPAAKPAAPQPVRVPEAEERRAVIAVAPPVVQPPPRPVAAPDEPAEQPSAAPAAPAAAAGPRDAAAPEAAAAAVPAARQPPAAPDPAAIAVPASLDDGLPWTYCGPPIGAPSDLRPAAPEVAADEAVDAEADAAETRVGDEVVTLTGDVRVRRGADLLRADRADYDRRNETIDAQGNVLLARPDIRVSGETARVDMATDRGEITAAEYRLVGTNARGTADVARFRGKAVSDYENITYTTCRPGRDDWILQADELQIDREEGLGDARDATVRLGGVPVAYVPRLIFPIDDRRRSGLLMPTLGTGDTRGFELSVPYYFNLAPNYDATLAPRVMSKRGVMLEGEFRHLSESSSSRLRGAFLPDDWEEPDLGARWAASVQHRQTWGRLTGDVNYNQVSDDTYLDDFGRSLYQNSARYLARRAGLNYGGDGWSLSALVSDYQSIDPTVNPYRLLPSIGFTGGHAEQLAGQTVQLGVGATYTNFDRDSGVVGQRVDLYPYLTVPWRSSWGYAVPKLGFRYTTYSLDDQPATRPDNPDRTLGVASLDGGLFFEREDEWFGSGVTQTLEPRFYYVYIPYRDQTDLPIFDTSVYSPIYEAYFLENLFTGPDRVNDANRVSLGITTRLIPHESGIEALRLSVGQAFFFDDRKVQLPGRSTATSTSSPLLGEVGLRFDRHWSAVASGQWDLLGGADTNQYDTSALLLAYNGDDGRFVRAGYGKTLGITEYADLAFTWPVSEQVALIGRWAYSLETDENMEALAGIEYGSCCWRVRAFARQYLKTASVTGDQLTGEQDTSFMVQLELRGLGAVGDNIEELLDRSLHGYLDDDFH